VGVSVGAGPLAFGTQEAVAYSPWSCAELVIDRWAVAVKTHLEIHGVEDVG